MPRTTRTPSSDPRFRGSNTSLATLPALPSESSSSKSASSVCWVATVPLDPVAIAANSLFASNGIHRVSAMATDSGLSPRQFERRFLAQVGVPPKLYARIIRFNAALDHKLRCPSPAWSRIANDQDYYDQMHLVHDCRAFTGESPSRFLAHLEGLPAFHTFFATPNRARHE